MPRREFRIGDIVTYPAPIGPNFGSIVSVRIPGEIEQIEESRIYVRWSLPIESLPRPVQKSDRALKLA